MCSLYTAISIFPHHVPMALVSSHVIVLFSVQSKMQEPNTITWLTWTGSGIHTCDCIVPCDVRNAGAYITC